MKPHKICVEGHNITNVDTLETLVPFMTLLNVTSTGRYYVNETVRDKFSRCKIFMIQDDYFIRDDVALRFTLYNQDRRYKKGLSGGITRVKLKKSSAVILHYERANHFWNIAQMIHTHFEEKVNSTENQTMNLSFNSTSIEIAKNYSAKTTRNDVVTPLGFVPINDFISVRLCPYVVPFQIYMKLETAYAFLITD